MDVKRMSRQLGTYMLGIKAYLNPSVAYRYNKIGNFFSKKISDLIKSINI